MGAILPGLAIGAPIAAGIFQARAFELESKAVASAARFNAAVTLEEAAVEAARRRRLARRETGREIAVFGKSGVTLEGSPLDFIVANAAERERDAVNVEIAARRTAGLDLARARNVRRAGETRSGAALLTGLAQGAFRGASLFIGGRR